MSLESKIEALTVAVNDLTKSMQSIDILPAEPTTRYALRDVAHGTEGRVEVTTLEQHAPVYATPPNPVASPQATVAMPVLPVFTQPAPTVTPQPVNAPFADGKGLIEYVVGAYQTMGPIRGAQIQGILTNLGYQNINDVKPDHYGDLFRAIETLRAS